MPIDASIPLGIQTPQPAQTMSQMAGVAQTMQNMQAQKLSMQAQQNQNVQTGIQTQEMQNMQPILSNIDKYMDPNGNVDFNKFVPDVLKVAPITGMNYVKLATDHQQQRALAQNAISSQSMAGKQAASNAIYSLSPDATSDDIAKTGDAVASTFQDPNAQAAAKKSFDDLISVKTLSNDPKHFQLAQQHAAAMFVPLTTQQQMATPEVSTVNNGQQSYGVNIKPGANIPQGSIVPGTYTQQQLPPNTPTIVNNVPGYLGAQPSGRNSTNSNNFPSVSPASQNSADNERLNILQNELSQEKDPSNQAALQREIDRTKQGIANRAPSVHQQSNFVPSALPIGATQNIVNNIDQMNSHYSSLQDSASSNQLIQSLTGNIQSLAAKAITGTESDKLAYANGLLAALPGHGHADDLKSATDLLQKNMAQLNLSTPASSDAARNLISAARPHSSMTPEAINDASSQLAAQVQANTAIRNHLTPYKYSNNGQGDPSAYQSARETMEKVADPRAWQYVNLGPGTPAAQKFINSLQPKDRQALGQKIQQLEQMGVLK